MKVRNREAEFHYDRSLRSCLFQDNALEVREGLRQTDRVLSSEVGKVLHVVLPDQYGMSFDRPVVVKKGGRSIVLTQQIVLVQPLCNDLAIVTTG